MASCIKEVPQKLTMEVALDYPEVFHLEQSDTIKMNIVSKSHIYYLQVLEKGDTLFEKENNVASDTSKHIKTFYNNFIYTPKSTGKKSLFFMIENYESRYTKKIEFTVE